MVSSSAVAALLHVIVVAMSCRCVLSTAASATAQISLPPQPPPPPLLQVPSPAAAVSSLTAGDAETGTGVSSRDVAVDSARAPYTAAQLSSDSSRSERAETPLAALVANSPLIWRAKRQIRVGYSHLSRGSTGGKGRQEPTARDKARIEAALAREDAAEAARQGEQQEAGGGQTMPCTLTVDMFERIFQLYEQYVIMKAQAEAGADNTQRIHS